MQTARRQSGEPPRRIPRFKPFRGLGVSSARANEPLAEPCRACACGDRDCEGTGDQVRLDAGAAGVAACGGHRRVLAVLGGGLADAPLPLGLHAGSVPRSGPANPSRRANPRVGHAAVRSAVRAGGALLVVILSRIDVRVFEGMLVLVVVVVVCLFLVDSAVSVIARILLAFWSRHVASLGLQWATGNYPAHRRPKRLRLRDRAASRRCFRRDTRLPTIGVPLCSQARLDPGAAGSVLSAEPSRQTRAPQPRWVVHGVMPATKSKHACWVENCGKFVQPLPSQSALVIGSTVDDGVSGG